MVSGPPAADLGEMIPQFAPETETAPVTVFIAARHERVRAALWQLLESEPGIEPLAATADLADMIRLLERLRPAVVVVEQAVLGDAGLDALAALAEVAPQAGIVVVGMHDHPGYVTRAREAGAADYVRLDEAADRLGPAVLGGVGAHWAVRPRRGGGEPRGERGARRRVPSRSSGCRRGARRARACRRARSRRSRRTGRTPDRRRARGRSTRPSASTISTATRLGARVLERVGHRLLGDPVERRLEIADRAASRAAGLVVEVDVELDVDARGCGRGRRAPRSPPRARARRGRRAGRRR